jgi:hypothetical protein
MSAYLLEGIPAPEPARAFDGVTYSPQEDFHRLRGQLKRVYEAMQDGQWHCLSHLAEVAGGSEAGVSARLRDLRKTRWGAHKIERERVSAGWWRYRLARPTPHESQDSHSRVCTSVG